MAIAVAATIAIGSIVIAIVVHGREKDGFEQVQRDEALRSARQAEAVASLSLGQLTSAAAFYQTVERLTRHKFEVMAKGLLHSGALSGTGLVLAVSNSDRKRFERTHGFPIIEFAPPGFHPVPSRPRYYPLAFAASDSGLEPPPGYDLGTDRLRSSYMFRAGDSGRPEATPIMRLPIGATGINVFHPIYRDGTPARTVAERRAALIGFAVGGFRLSDLIATARSALNDGSSLELLEGGRRISGPEQARPEAAAARLRIANRTWLLVVRDPSRPGMGLPILIAVVGVSLSALLTALILVWSRNEHIQALQIQAGQDPLTGLRNRRLFEESLRTEMARARRDRRPGALLMLDLDNFKQVNDTLGHQAGDRAIEGIAAALHERMRDTDVLARLGGDEFAIVLPGCDAAAARRVGQEIAAAIRALQPEDGAAAITASIGIAVFGANPAISLESVVSEADAAMYAAKDAGGDRVRVFDPLAVREGA